MKSLIGLIDEQLEIHDAVLDVGCGRSTFLQHIKKPLYKVGVDSYEPYLIKSRLGFFHQECILADARSLPFRTKSFDCGLAIEVIEHLTKPDGFLMLEELERVAKKKVILTTPNGFFPAQPGSADNPDEEHLCGWSAQEFRKLGFKVYGFSGCRILWQKKGILKFFPERLYSIFRRIGVVVAYYYPAFAFQLFCVKDVSVPVKHMRL